LARFEEISMEDAEVVVVAYGGTARSAKKAVRDARAEGIKAGLLRVITLWPFPETRVAKLREMGLKAVIVPEMNMGQYVLPVKRVIGDACPVIPLNKVAGQFIEPKDILEAIKGAM